MPYRDFDTAFWNDPFIQRLPKDGKMLYLYLWTNEHCNQAGLYEITPRTIAFETSLSEDEIPELFNLLKDKVQWYAEANLVWVKAFLKRQARSSKFLQAAAKALTTIHHNDAVHEVIEYNAKKYRISIPYQYYMDRIRGELWSAAAAGTVTGSVSGLGEGVSLFSSFSLVRSRLLRAVSGVVDRLTEHEMVKQELTLIGREQGLEPRSEYQTASGRVDLCFFDSRGKLVAAFEIDVYEPRDKSLVKLSALDCPLKCIILRTGVTPHSIEQGIHLIGLGIGQEIETGEAVPRSRTEAGETLCEGDQEVISTWCSVKGFDLSLSDASELVARMRKEFTGVDILEESKKWAAHKLSEPLTKKSRLSTQLWNWMCNARKFAEERKGKGRGDSNKYIQGKYGHMVRR